MELSLADLSNVDALFARLHVGEIDRVTRKLEYNERNERLVESLIYVGARRGR